MKRTIICLLILALTVIFLSSCALRGIGDREPYILFDENGNMLCDYYVLNVWLCDSKPAADGEYKYAAHRYHQIDGINGWMDLVTYGEELKTIEHAMALYSSYGVNTESVTFEHYGKPNGNAKVLKMVLRSELKNGGVYSYEGFPYFCAEVIGISKDFITVSPLDGTVEKYVADTLSVSSDTTELGVSADELRELYLTTRTSYAKENGIDDYDTKLGCYTGEFFEDNVLILALFSSGASGDRFKITSITLTDGIFKIDFEQTQGGNYADGSEWLFCVAVPRSIAKKVKRVRGCQVQIKRRTRYAQKNNIRSDRDNSAFFRAFVLRRRARRGHRARILSLDFQNDRSHPR